MGAADFKKNHNSAFLVTCTAGLEGEARREIRRALPQAEFDQLFLKGNLLLLSDGAENNVISTLRNAETRCISRITPLQAKVEISPQLEESVTTIADAAHHIRRLQEGETFCVRCNRRGRHEFASREIAKGSALLLETKTGAQGEYETTTDWRVSIEIFQDIAFIGINPPQHTVHKELLTKRKYAPGERPFNRAEQKIKEALELFNIHIDSGSQVLDLGAAPGGWTIHLASLAKEVQAVDPAELAPEVETLENVVHHRCRAEILAQREDLQETFDLITNDMNIEPAASARLMLKTAPMLRRGKSAIMTIKYMTRQRRRQEKEVVTILSEAYEDIQLQHLPHNRLETTVAMRRKLS